MSTKWNANSLNQDLNSGCPFLTMITITLQLPPEFKLCKLCLKNEPCITSCSCREVSKYTRKKFALCLGIYPWFSG